MVSTPLASGRPPSPPNAQPAHSSTPDPTGGPSDIFFLTAQPKLHKIARAPHHYSFKPKILPNHPDGVYSKNSTKNSSKLPSRGPSEFSDQTSSKSPNQGPLKISQETPSESPSQHPFTHPRKIPSKYPSNTHFTKTYPHNPLPHTQTTSHSLPSPTILPLTPPLLHPIPGFIMPHWRPQGSHCTRHQGWIPFPGLVQDAVAHPVVYRG